MSRTMSRINTSLMATHDIAEICKDLFKAAEINFFSYSRVYKDGSRAELWSDPNALEHTFFKKKYITGTYTADYYNINERYVLLDSKIESFPDLIRDKYSMHLVDQRIIFDHTSPFEIVIKLNDSCEFFSFYSSASRRSAEIFYINNLATFEQFSSFFKIVAASLISAASSQRLVKASSPPDAPRLGNDILPRPKAWGLVSSHPQLLTGRQLEIARHIITGQTARQIGHRLGLSARTVETHIDNMKSRLGCSNKTELLVQFSHLGMI
ncbi:response regulator transcription factor [Paraburkholderia megapolitana]|uniref:Regulatory protein, luxR family n=1 Tax=Paraburkholderia megapolitana TaxID=420953 RepID=A0A1I3TUE6_9BURK|nr:LuxR C-terminal-related transcriptional regulator [Paraburkholderia megapolitana]QDQ83398.1 response regulator transcription factor [Paraburkholderia megapolitana]SFJ73201.1 regulatory protein, luxR family [Paraburkholderia megapolitana]